MAEHINRARYKRPLDLVIVVGAHVVPPVSFVLWIMWLLIALLVWLEDRGSVFYIQKRVGKCGREFKLIKFRTMRVSQAEGEPTKLATSDDLRVTRVGRFLRRTALDELPQVLNILAGHLSLVGPRPATPDIHEELMCLSPEAHRRMLVRPGLTGLAQVYGGYGARPSAKLRFDLLYIKRVSLWFDIRLIFVSILKSLTARWKAEVEEAKRSGVTPLPGKVGL